MQAFTSQFTAKEIERILSKGKDLCESTSNICTRQIKSINFEPQFKLNEKQLNNITKVIKNFTVTSNRIIKINSFIDTEEE